ncbi:uncharacterized protein J3D65DRAFT_643048 [Phyllosticta citribraziliensis]|uniref:Uncharacterized protein n=1 Tax=Phyllosticta citribraziliensis TaxID=989973 RepID=A0ABR1L680_9PEZI
MVAFECEAGRAGVKFKGKFHRTLASSHVTLRQAKAASMCLGIFPAASAKGLSTQRLWRCVSIVVLASPQACVLVFCFCDTTKDLRNAGIRPVSHARGSRGWGGRDARSVRDGSQGAQPGEVGLHPSRTSSRLDCAGMAGRCSTREGQEIVIVVQNNTRATEEVGATMARR